MIIAELKDARSATAQLRRGVKTNASFKRQR